MAKNGITFVGNILTDNVKLVESYPEKGMLSTITAESLAVGGCVPNTAIDIKKLDNNLRVSVYGKVGKDYKGDYVVGEMQKIGIDVSGISFSETQPTSYSDVITVKDTGERTFFHNRGANKEFSPEDVDVEKLDCKILHAGYLMLLDSFDKLEGDTTPMAKFLERVRSRGIKTSIDLVSESSGNFSKVASAALKHCDYVIINEIESGAIAKIKPRNDSGALDISAIRLITEKLLSLGVKEKVIVHCPEVGFCMNKDGTFTSVDSIKLPKGFIKGSVGAGDAFCAGALYAIYNGYSDGEILSFANKVAISCLSEADSVSGIKSAKALDEFISKI